MPVAFLSWCWFGGFFSFLLLLVYRVRLRTETQKIKKADVSKYALFVACTGTMQATTNAALDHVPIGYALALFQLSLIVSVWLGHRVFNEKGVKKKLIGSGIMIVGSIVIILLK